ncbi:hypothetical protein DY000_02054320 [Brassica cretica]|uniref:Uncharacterized protein n=1 Tax=Brassica cretica TaxID=69181 RepID=A0ABQ7A5I0_BRACR|nr:hypothetical protein DY000_02054320 [Brassica cretica]
MSKKSSSVKSIELELPAQTKHQFDLRSPISPRSRTRHPSRGLPSSHHADLNLLNQSLKRTQRRQGLASSLMLSRQIGHSIAIGRRVTCSDQSLVITSRTTGSDSHNELTATGTNSREEEFDKNKLISCYKQQEEPTHEP